MTGRLWHGGFPGLGVGDLLLPPSVTGNARQARVRNQLTAAYRRLDPAMITPDDVSTGWVYVTGVRNMALAFAASSRHQYGGAAALYVVEAVGEVEADPDFPSQALRVRAARITCVYDPHVNISDERAARLHAAALAAERGTSTREQWRSMHRMVRDVQ